MERPGSGIAVRFSPMDHVYGLGGGGSPTLDLHGRTVKADRKRFSTPAMDTAFICLLSKRSPTI